MKPVVLRTFLTCFSIAIVLTAICSPRQADAQVVQRAVGGVAIDADGVVSVPSVEDEQALAEVRRNAQVDAPEELQKFTELRGVSLKQLEATLAECLAEGKPIPEAVRYLAGLQRVQFVLVYPEQNDVVLAGPAEGWRMDSLGNVVGATTGRPVLLLDDLIVAMRSSEASRLEPISCSIDPTAEGMQRLQSVVSTLRTIGNPQTTMRRLEEALGPQVVSVAGVPETSHFARVMVAADFRMKRLAMNFEPAPVSNLPSFLHLIKGSRGKSSTTPRWWMAPNYDPLARDAEGLAWELRGPGVKCLTEQDHFDASGKRQQSGKASKAAQRWAQLFTEQYSELADHDSTFGQLRNVMDLAVIAALIDKEQLMVRAGCELPTLMNEASPSVFHAPKQVASQVSFIERHGNFTISASGGVQMLPWQIADRIEEVSTVGNVRDGISPISDQWWIE